MEDFPAVVTMGVTEFQHGLGRAWRELESGAVVHVVHKRSGLHRAWLVPELPEGFEAVRITCNGLRNHIGPVLDRVRDDEVFEVCDSRGVQPGNTSAQVQVRGYLMRTPPDSLARQPAALQFYVKSKLGRALLREFASATATEARA